MDENSMIYLDRVTKVFPGTDAPAVEELTLDIRKGEILVLVGPSGCGKSTTLRLINRMIEPSGGTIFFDGEDVTHVDPDHLRRRIGYVIQQIGLFPHQTIAENVATVPKMLGWDKKRISARVDELLDVMGLEPSEYRDRYPKELSGGQAQRVGVARALGADPDVMLMDEPFGAIDPITRDRLQNEFLRVQAVLGKTIVFVTHDIDEAIKMGDRIAILGERSVVKQIDTPERILALPADDFVDDFIGTGSTLKGLHFERVSGLELQQYPTMTLDEPFEAGLATLRASGREWLLLLDGERRPVRWLRASDLKRGGAAHDLLKRGQHVRSRVEENATLHDTLELMLESSTGGACG
jgi:osmoprotectant transport system ATP-binding protein